MRPISCSHVVARLAALPAVIALALLAPPAASGQSCWSYVNTPAVVPLECVQQGNHALACSWGEAGACPGNPGISGQFREECHEDGDPSDCCVAIPGPPGQSVRQMHHAWHSCFGPVGDLCDGDSPPQRGNRWYAFHRQIEADYNLWRQGFACNPMMGQYLGCKIESFQWCPDMTLQFGYDCDDAAPAGCGDPGERAANVACPTCNAFPRCFFRGGAGPMACPLAPSNSCAAGPINLPHDELEDFSSIEEVANLLDLSFHGAMHSAVGASGPCKDINDPQCSVRDPMFWRLHKAIDDVVREWQNVHAADVMLVIDRSGSMDQLDSSGDTKLAVALEAADLFAQLMVGAAPVGQTNNVGIVSYASSAGDAARNLVPPVAATATLRDAGQPFPNTLDAIETAGGGGCTGIGPGVEAALAAICPGGDCGSIPDPPPAGTNRRKGLLLLTDGVENVPPCLSPAGPAGGTCGGQCFGAELDYTDLYDAQVCAVGFGDTGSLNGDLLTLFAERQGGIYMQSPAAGPDGAWIDLKDFYAKCFGQLTDEFLGLDPKGVLEVHQAASEPVEYTSCGDGKITVVSGWKEPVAPGELRLVVTAPSGDVVLAAAPEVDASTEPTWDFDRIRLPYRGSASGTWRAQLVRPHRAFVNGFASDAFASLDEGTALVRRQIQRLCPEGACRRVLLFEDVVRGDSAYRKALALEEAAGLVGTIEAVGDPRELARRLRSDWDLLVYAHQGADRPEPYDPMLAERLCGGLRAILTDTRRQAAAAILKCAGAAADGSRNHRRLDTEAVLDGRSFELADPGHGVFSVGLAAAGTAVEGRFGERSAGVVVRAERGQAHRWFVDVLVRGTSRLEAHRPVIRVKTGDDLLPTVRIAPMSVLDGGYDSVDARVEIERPLVGLGTLLARARPREPYRIGEELIDARAATLLALGEGGRTVIPTATDVYPLFDDGTHGDITAGNAYWSAQLPDLATADGMVRYRFLLDLEKDGCVTRRELTQSLWVEVGVDPASSGVQVQPGPAGGVTVTLTPRDRLGNLWGPGRPVRPSCGPAGACKCDPEGLKDLGRGTYALELRTAPNARVCTIDAFGARFEIPLGAPQAGSCDALRKTIERATLGSLLRLRLDAAAGRVCSTLTAATGELAVARAGAAGALAEIAHELSSHGAELPAAERVALERALEGVVREHGLDLPAGGGHDH
jgi:hypothetical protein